jgi:SSS family transporter
MGAMSDVAVYAAVLAGYMGLLLLIGALASRRSSTREGFYLGGRTIGPWVTSLSYVAAYFSSVLIIGGGGFGYRFGLATLWVGAINVLVGITLVWIILGRRLRRLTARLGTMTVPGFLAERYGSRSARVISALVIAVFLVIYNVSILKGMGNAFEGLMELPYTAGVLLAGAIIVLYVVWGGYTAVVWTGFFQAWLMGTGLVLLTVYTLRATDGLGSLAHRLAAIDPGLVETPGAWGWAGLISFAMIVSFGVWGMPQLLVRFYSIRSERVLRVGVVVASLGGCLALLPYLLGAAARVLHPGLSHADLAIPTLSKAVLPPWAAALFLAGVIAAGMSTFAAVLIITSGALVEDLVVKGLRRGLSERRAVRASRIVSAAVGLVSLAIALRPPALVLVLTAFAWSAIASACLWPIVLGVTWRRATRQGVLASMLGGLVVTLVWMALGSPLGIHGFLPGIVIGLALLIVGSLLTPRPSIDVLGAAMAGEPHDAR